MFEKQNVKLLEYFVQVFLCFFVFINKILLAIVFSKIAWATMSYIKPFLLLIVLSERLLKSTFKIVLNLPWLMIAYRTTTLLSNDLKDPFAMFCLNCFTRFNGGPIFISEEVFLATKTLVRHK